MGLPVRDEADVADIHDDSFGEVSRLVGAGLRWSLLNIVFMRMGTLLSGIVLARLLVPEDFGRFAIALVVAQALLEINDLGIMNALVRAQSDPNDLVATGATLTFLSSCVLYAVTFLAAPLIAGLVRMPGVTSMIRVIALVVVIDGLSAIPAAMLTRSFRQDKRAVADALGLVVNITVTVWLAKEGVGAWSFVAGRLAGNSLSGVLVFVLSGVRFRPGWSSAAARELLHFGLPLAGAGLVNFALLNTDYVIVGRFLGGVQLGYYVLAFNLASFPVNVLTMAVRRVSVAAYGRYAGDRDRLGRSLVSSVHLIATGAALLAMLLAVTALPLVTVAYGNKWRPAASVVGLLAVMGAIRVLANLVQDFLTAIARTRLVFSLQLTWLVVLIPALVVGAHVGGIRGVGFAHAVVAAAIAMPLLVIALPRASGVPIGRVVAALARPAFGAGVGVIGAALVLRATNGSMQWNLIAGLCVSALCFALVALRAEEWRAARLVLGRGGSSVRPFR